MSFVRTLFLFVLVASGLSLPQKATDKPSDQERQRRSERSREAGESSSRDTRIDLSPPKDDEKNHANSSIPTDDNADTSDVQEFHPWDAHKAIKDIEVGDFYFKKKNYRAALDRYREALEYKPNDAIANFRLGQCLEKMSQPQEARLHYEEYLKILPHGPLAEEAQKQLQKLRASEGK
jgi:tetratricopeptide (TPR) repeat protein